MQHRIEDYTDGDLAVAIQSPYVDLATKDEIESEMNSRIFKRESDIEHLKRFMRTS